MRRNKFYEIKTVRSCAVKKNKLWNNSISNGYSLMNDIIPGKGHIFLLTFFNHFHNFTHEQLHNGRQTSFKDLKIKKKQKSGQCLYVCVSRESLVTAIPQGLQMWKSKCRSYQMHISHTPECPSLTCSATVFSFSCTNCNVTWLKNL